MNYISIKHIELAEACLGQVDLFREIFGESVSFSSKEEAVDLAVKHAQDFDFDFIGMEIFKEAYEEAKAPLLKSYEEAEAPLWKAYEEAEAPLWKAYKEGLARTFAGMWWDKE